MGVLYHVHADWDAEAAVWVATSGDVPGLSVEAPTMEALAEKLRTLIPELLEANRHLVGEQPDAIAFELTSRHQVELRLRPEGGPGSHPVDRAWATLPFERPVDGILDEMRGPRPKKP